eukprot:m.114055 g.114055  ORF g.114055 m.114055 type:complete len:79 (+) comp13038_c1_seq1:676-912(+)
MLGHIDHAIELTFSLDPSESNGCNTPSQSKTYVKGIPRFDVGVALLEVVKLIERGGVGVFLHVLGDVGLKLSKLYIQG